jgi:hypothetical protein
MQRAENICHSPKRRAGQSWSNQVTGDFSQFSDAWRSSGERYAGTHHNDLELSVTVGSEARSSKHESDPFKIFFAAEVTRADPPALQPVGTFGMRLPMLDEWPESCAGLHAKCIDKRGTSNDIRAIVENKGDQFRQMAAALLPIAIV